MASNLTTLFLAKEYIGIKNASPQDDAKLTSMIGYVSEMIAKHCDREFAFSTYKRWYNGSGENCMVLPFYPIVNLYGVSYFTYIAGRVTCAATGNPFQFSSWTVTETEIQLMYWTVAGVQTYKSYALSDTKTIGTLMAEIQADSAITWTSNVQWDNNPSSTIAPSAGQWISTPYVAFINVVGKLEQCFLRQQTNAVIELYGGARFPQGHSNVFAWYTAGYTLPVDNAEHTALDVAGNVPSGLTGICNEIVKRVWHSTKEQVSEQGADDIGDIGYHPGGSTANRPILKIVFDFAESLTPYSRPTI